MNILFKKYNIFENNKIRIIKTLAEAIEKSNKMEVLDKHIIKEEELRQ